jgi:hypothetical protein
VQPSPSSLAFFPLSVSAAERSRRCTSVQLQPQADPLGEFRGREGGAAAKEWIVNQFATPAVVQDRAPHEVNRLLRWMIEFIFVASTQDEFGIGRRPDCGVLAGLALPRSVLFSDIPGWLVLKPVVRAREHGSAFVLDDLLVMNEADAHQRVKDFPREPRSMPDVGCRLGTRAKHPTNPPAYRR